MNNKSKNAMTAASEVARSRKMSGIMAASLLRPTIPVLHPIQKMATLQYENTMVNIISMKCQNDVEMM
jgi:hypothetical protein